MDTSSFLAAPASPAVLAEESKALSQWLQQMQAGAKRRSYSGVFVVHSGNTMSSAKISHVAHNGQQAERVETLTGAPRIIYRHNSQVVTYLPLQKTLRRETRESSGLLPGLLKAEGSQIGQRYQLRLDGSERVAGVEADKVLLLPRDNLRYGYRVWAERTTALVVKLQTLDADGRVLEQAAFSQLELAAPIKIETLVRQMAQSQGWQEQKDSAPALVKTTAQAEGWMLKAPIPGFETTAGYKRPASASQPSAPAQATPFQWVFSDGMASVSVFIEPYDAQRHATAASGGSVGATQTWSQRVDGYWLTLMGEVPSATLRLFASQLVRMKG